MDALLEALLHDPSRTWKRAAAMAALTAAAALGVTVLVRANARERAMCQSGGARIESVWGARAKADVARAFDATSLPYAGAAVTAASALLDDYARNWAHVSDDSCAATRLRGEQSEEVMDLRAACLSTRLREMEALVDELRHADADVVTKAAKATKLLPPLDECSDVAALRAPSPRPRDPETRARVEALEAKLAAAEAQVSLGKDKEALAKADAILPDAEKTGFGPLVARTQFWRGRAAASLNEGKISIPAFESAFAAALASKDDRVLKDSSARLAQEFIYVYDVDRYETWVRVAQAAIDRGTPDPVLQSFVDHTRCVALWQPGRMRARLDCLEKHAAKVEKVRPLDEWELTTLGLAASDAGAFARGVDYTRRGHAYSLAQNGPMHPRTLEMRGFVCKALLDFGDWDAALAECTEAVKVAESVRADNAFVIGKIRMFWGAALREAGRFDEARAQLELARPHADKAEVEDEIAQLEMASGNAAQAVDTLRNALDVVMKDLPPAHPNVIVSRLSLGEALLQTRAVVEARKVLDGALAECEHADINPLTVADVTFAAARARVRPVSTKSPETATADARASALDLAKRARDAYERSAPRSKKYDKARARIDAFIAQLDAP